MYSDSDCSSCSDDLSFVKLYEVLKTGYQALDTLDGGSFYRACCTKSTEFSIEYKFVSRVLFLANQTGDLDPRHSSIVLQGIKRHLEIITQISIHCIKNRLEWIEFAKHVLYVSYHLMDSLPSLPEGAEHPVALYVERVLKELYNSNIQDKTECVVDQILISLVVKSVSSEAVAAYLLKGTLAKILCNKLKYAPIFYCKIEGKICNSESQPLEECGPCVVSNCKLFLRIIYLCEIREVRNMLIQSYLAVLEEYFKRTFQTRRGTDLYCELISLLKMTLFPQQILSIPQIWDQIPISSPLIRLLFDPLCLEEHRWNLLNNLTEFITQSGFLKTVLAVFHDIRPIDTWKKVYCLSFYTTVLQSGHEPLLLELFATQRKHQNHKDPTWKELYEYLLSSNYSSKTQFTICLAENINIDQDTISREHLIFDPTKPASLSIITAILQFWQSDPLVMEMIVPLLRSLNQCMGGLFNHSGILSLVLQHLAYTFILSTPQSRRFFAQAQRVERSLEDAKIAISLIPKEIKPTHKTHITKIIQEMYVLQLCNALQMDW